MITPATARTRQARNELVAAFRRAALQALREAAGPVPMAALLATVAQHLQAQGGLPMPTGQAMVQAMASLRKHQRVTWTANGFSYWPASGGSQDGPPAGT